MRHPFPGPGLAIRILGPVTREQVKILQQADKIYIEEIRNAGLYDQIAQAFAVLLPVKAVGVMGDARTYEQVIALRAVQSEDFMTADWYVFSCFPELSRPSASFCFDRHRVSSAFFADGWSFFFEFGWAYLCFCSHRPYLPRLRLRLSALNNFVLTNLIFPSDRYVFPAEVLKKISSRITNEVSGINRVTYDISSKPPAVRAFCVFMSIGNVADDWLFI